MIRTWALLRWCSTKRRYIKCTYLYLLPFSLLFLSRIDCIMDRSFPLLSVLCFLQFFSNVDCVHAVMLFNHDILGHSLRHCPGKVPPTWLCYMPEIWLLSLFWHSARVECFSIIRFFLAVVFDRLYVWLWCADVCRADRRSRSHRRRQVMMLVSLSLLLLLLLLLLHQ